MTGYHYKGNIHTSSWFITVMLPRILRLQSPPPPLWEAIRARLLLQANKYHTLHSDIPTCTLPIWRADQPWNRVSKFSLWVFIWALLQKIALIPVFQSNDWKAILAQQSLSLTFRFSFEAKKVFYHMTNYQPHDFVIEAADKTSSILVQHYWEKYFYARAENVL